MADLQAIFTKLELPEDLATWLSTGLSNTSISMFLDMVVRKEYETELRGMVRSKFVVSDTFKEDKQRLYITKACGAFRVAMETEDEQKLAAEEEEDDGARGRS